MGGIIERLLPGCDIGEESGAAGDSGFAQLFGFANLAAMACVFVAAHLFGAFGDDRGNGKLAPMAVDGDKGEVGGADVTALSGEVTLDPDLDSNFHGSVIDAVDGRLEDDKVADARGCEEIEMVGGGGDDVAARMAMGGESSGKIDPMHEATAEKSAEWVGVVGEYEFHHLGSGVGDGTGIQIFRKLHVPHWQGRGAL